MCSSDLGVALAQFHSPWWLLLPAFVGANLIQSAFTGFCPPTLVLTKLGWVDDDSVIHWGGRHPAKPASTADVHS